MKNSLFKYNKKNSSKLNKKPLLTNKYNNLNNK